MFSREEIEPLFVRIVGIYATRFGCMGNCFGAAETDGFVPETARRSSRSVRYHVPCSNTSGS